MQRSWWKSRAAPWVRWGPRLRHRQGEDAKYHNEAQEAETDGNAGPKAQIDRKGRPRRPKWKERNAHRAKMKDDKAQKAKMKGEKPKWQSLGPGPRAKTLGLTGNAVA